jgi:hypothetical protein
MPRPHRQSTLSPPATPCVGCQQQHHHTTPQHSNMNLPPTPLQPLHSLVASATPRLKLRGSRPPAAAPPASAAARPGGSPAGQGRAAKRPGACGGAAAASARVAARGPSTWVPTRARWVVMRCWARSRKGALNSACGEGRRGGGGSRGKETHKCGGYLWLLVVVMGRGGLSGAYFVGHTQVEGGRGGEGRGGGKKRMLLHSAGSMRHSPWFFEEQHQGHTRQHTGGAATQAHQATTATAHSTPAPHQQLGGRGRIVSKKTGPLPLLLRHAVEAAGRGPWSQPTNHATMPLPHLPHTERPP